jgi:branched-chain amino acid transport system substrate-binding protein
MAQADFGADIAKIRSSGADAVFAFYPGSPSITFVRQWAQSGLADKVKLYSNLSLTEPLQFPAQGKAAIGLTISGHYFAALDNPANKRFVSDFRAKHKRDPSMFAANQYDGIMLLDAALREVKGNFKNEAAFRAALRKANFSSVRGSFKFNSNHMPIMDNYISVVEARADGSLYLKPLSIIAENIRDEYAPKCPMK